MRNDEASTQPHVLMQTAIPLPGLGGELPVIVTTDQHGYVPVVALCQMMGISATTYLPKWQRAPLWAEALKLPWQTPTRGRRAVWCLERHTLPAALALIARDDVAPERQHQLARLAQDFERALQLTYATRLEEYRAFRRMLFRLLTTYARIAERLQSFRERLGVVLNPQAMEGVNALLDEGETIIEAGANFAANHVRLLGDVALPPTWDAESDVSAALDVPFPPIARADFETLSHHLDRFSAWQDRLDALLQQYGFA